MQTTTKHTIIILSISVVIAAGCFLFFYKKNSSSHQFSYKVFKGADGWGYDILVDNKTFIHQDHVPVIPVNTGFKEKEQAGKVAEIVIDKLKHNLAPTLSEQDLEKVAPLENIGSKSSD